MGSRAMPEIRTAYENCWNLQQSDIDHLISLGVPALALAQPLVLVKKRVTFWSGRRFDFDPAGDVAIIVPAVEDGDLRDLVAWRPRSGDLASWDGNVSALGWGDLYAPNLTGDPLRVWANPLGWLRSARRGIVPIEIDAVARSLFLWGDHVSEFACESPVHARAIKAAFTRKAPRVLVPKPNLVEAA